MLIYGLAGIGALVGLKGLGKVMRFAKYCLTRPISLQRTYGENTWALITGGSRGIGLEFARQLGAKGFNIIILDKKVDQSIKLTTKIFGQQSTEANFLYLESDLLNIEDVQRILSQYDISILVNSAGITYINLLTNRTPGSFTSLPFKEHSQVISTNCLGTINITYAILKQYIQS